MPNSIVLIRPNGSQVVSDETSVASLEKLGYRRQTDEERSLENVEAMNRADFSTITEKAKTAVEGGLSGLTLGLSDLALTSEESKARARYNPGTRIASEVVGAIAPAFLSGGETLLAKGLSKTPMGLLTKGGKAIEGAVSGAKGVALAGAVEGGVAGIGSAITQAKINGDPITVESLLSGGSTGAMLGGSIGYLAGKLQKVKPLENILTGADDVVSKNVDNVLDDFYSSLPKDKAVAKDVPVWKNVADDIKYVEKTAVKADVANFVPLESFGTIKVGLNESLSAIDDVVKTVDNVINDSASKFRIAESEITNLTTKAGALKIKGLKEATASPLAEIKRALKAKDVEAMDVALGNYVGALEKQLGSGAIAGKEKIVKAIEEFGATSKAVKEVVSLKTAADALKDFPDTIENFRKLKANKAEKLFAALDSIDNRKEFASIHSYFDKTLEDMGLTMSGTAGEKARAIWESAKTPGFFKTEEQILNKVRFNLSDNADELVKEFNVPPKKPFPSEIPDTRTTLLGEEELAQINMPKFVDDTTATAVTTSSGETGKRGGSHFWKKVARSASSRMSAKAARSVGLGVIGSALAFEAGGSVTDMAAGAALGSLAGGTRVNTVSRVRAAARKAAAPVGNFLRKTAGQFGRLDVRIDGTLDTANTKKRIEEVNNMIPSIRDRAFKVMEEDAIEHPELTKSFIDTAEKQLMALKSLLPVDPGLAFANGISLWEPDPVQKVQTSKALNVYHDPVGTAEYLADGNMDVFTAKAFKTIWPALYSEFQSELAIEVLPKVPQLSYDEQSYYALITEMPFHSSFTPRSMAQTQAVYASAGQEERGAKNTGAQTNKGGRPAKTEPPTAGQTLLT